MGIRLDFLDPSLLKGEYEMDYDIFVDKDGFAKQFMTFATMKFIEQTLPKDKNTDILLSFLDICSRHNVDAQTALAILEEFKDILNKGDDKPNG